MYGQSVWSLAVATVFGPVVLAQLSGWEANQVNTTLCTWQGLRVAVVRDTVYMDGGYSFWRPGLSSDEYGDVLLDRQNKPGIVFSLNFSTPFNTSQNISALFGQQIKGTTTPLYYDGAMLANDDEYFLYGGMLTQESNGNTVEPVDNQGLEYAGYSYGVEKPAFAAGFVTYQLTGDITRYLAYGGAANVPSENLAFYFSGLHGPTWGEIYYPNGNASITANVVSDTLITLDMTTQQEETWSNDTLSDGISGRASPELIWVPVGKQGILVALGGVVYPEFVNGGGHYSSNKTASEEQSPIFMSDINIYDIANKTWYTQSTSGGPGVALAQGCAVMQPAKDFSSFNIYWYGGYDGVHVSNETYWTDAVWVLSLPSFTWKQVASQRSGMARAGHKCVMPYPDQMMVIGGIPVAAGGGYTCLQDFIQIFNVSSAEWLDGYDPTVHHEYLVPSAVHEAIGGDGSGGATTTAPSSWDDPGLEDVFQVAYATSKITTWYPYAKATTTSSTNPTYTDNSKGSGGSGGAPKFLGPVLGAILGLVFLLSLVVGVLLWRRRRLLKKNGGVSVVNNDDGQGGRIMSWLNGQQKTADMAHNKAETVTTTSELLHPVTPTPDLARFNQASQYPFTQVYQVPEQHSRPQGHIHYEVDNNEVIELPDNSPGAAELSDTAMSPSDIVQRRFTNASPVTASQGWSSIQLTDQGSIVSSTSFPRNIPPAPPSSASYGTSSVAGGRGRSRPPPPHRENQQNQQQQRSPTRPESTALPTPLASVYDAKELPATPLPSSPQNKNNNNPSSATTPRGESGVSAFSERERSHLRNISDPATVSTMDGTIAPRSQTTLGGRVGSPMILEEGVIEKANAAQTPGMVSPPTAGEADERSDYLGEGALGGVVSPVDGRLADSGLGVVRRSAFRESDEDLGGRGS